MADPNTNPTQDIQDEEVDTNHALEQGLGVGARELASIRESGEAGTLERDAESDAELDDDVTASGTGRAERKS